MNNFNNIYKRLHSFCTYNLLLYANFLVLFGIALNITTETIITIAKILLPAYLLVGIGGYFMNDLFDQKQDFTPVMKSNKLELDKNKFELINNDLIVKIKLEVLRV